MSRRKDGEEEELVVNNVGLGWILLGSLMGRVFGRGKRERERENR